MVTELKAKITGHFAALEDPRTGPAILHRLIDIVVIALCAVICGADDWEEVELFGQAKYDWLKRFLELPHGIPSHDTFNRVFARLDPAQFEQCFLSWVQAVAEVTKGQVIALDGKTLRRSHDRYLGKEAIHMVSAWASDNRLVLSQPPIGAIGGQIKVEEKSNEITALPQLLRLLDISGCVVTVDALGCQKEIARQIVSQGGDYVFALKGNQGLLQERVQTLFAHSETRDGQRMEQDKTRKLDKEHGRLEKRSCQTVVTQDWLFYLDPDGEWPRLQTIAKVVARREAEEARALKARLAATVSHELRGPLNLILGFSKLMALSPESYKEPLPPAYRTDVHTIYRNSQHLLSLVDDILDLSQIEAQRLPLVKDRIDMEEDVVKKVVDIVQPLAERKGLYLNQVLAGGLPWVLADGVRLRQALLNMLTNAVRFTERGGITVSTGRNDDRLLVSVRDTGPGIAPEDLPKLFKEFAQVSRQAESREEGGSGLGLSISKHLIELHGGEIWAESQKGLGTTFHFTVPLPGTEPIALATIRTEDLKQRMASQQSCLIVHDDPDIVRLLARYIEGYRVIGLPDERAVLTLTEELHPRAIIATPELAAEITERLSHLPFDIPIVSCAMPRMRERTYLQGVFSYLVKPIMPEMLTAVMKQVERDGETTVLLVDDDPDVVRLLERMLTMLPRSYRVLKAYDGLEALEVMQDELPDVVFLDLVMPALDGEQVVSRMREDERLRNVPVVIISARDRIEGKAALETPISVRCKRPVEVARAAKCLQALLDALNPSYLPEPEEPAQPALRSLEQSAFAALWPRPTPAPDAVG